ncbi:MAG: hypothetical protein H7287_00035 [Thermoleophilia bacterium]|nr:hypothetical protein [Thermoleophilia bacterium]
MPGNLPAMRRRLISVLLIALALATTAAATLASALSTQVRPEVGRLMSISSPTRPRAAADTAAIRIRYERSPAADRAAAQLVRRDGFAGVVAKTLTRDLALKHDITVVFGGNPAGPFYDRTKHTIEYPWSFVTTTSELLDSSGYRGAQLTQATLDATQFIVEHEIGHALIDQYDLPVLGREEDAADSFAAFVAVELHDDGELVIGATDLFAAFADTSKTAQQISGVAADESEFSDPHSSDLSRFYTISCLVYGADTTRYANVIADLGLSKTRLANCPAQWRQASDSWHQVLDPHLNG